MKRLLFALVIFLAGNVCHGQILDDFGDGELLTNPEWKGDVANFKVNAALELQLNASDAGSSVIYTPLTIQDSCEWQFYFRLDFAPSNTNLLRVYLQSDSPDVQNAKAYYLEVGETGNLDALRLYRQDGPGAKSLLGTFTLGTLANQPAVCRLKISRNPTGVWQFFADYTGGKNFVKELELTDATYGKGDYYFGFYCLYSATRKDKFYFDDISIKQPVPDTEPPTITSWKVTGQNTFDLTYNEPVDKASAETGSNYIVNNTIGSAVTAVLDQVNTNMVHLSFGNPFQSLQQYNLEVSGVKDLTGNAMQPNQIDFIYTAGKKPLPGDVLINEIMADPSPVVGLPEVEFVELYNISTELISVKDLIFKDGSTSASLPDINLLPGGYYILCAQKDTALLKIFGKTIGVPTLPSINNSGDNLELRSIDGKVIDAVNFSDTWYQDNIKKDGGWTLELINPLNKCLGKENWTASTSAIGGTPGKQNAVFNPAPDTDPPYITSIFAINADTILVNFNEKTDNNVSQWIDLFTLATKADVVDILSTADRSGVLLVVEPALTEGIYYQLNLAPGFRDCSGNAMVQSQAIEFALPAKPGYHDLVLNEILYNPRTSGYDYLEIYNRTDKVFNLADITVVNSYGTGNRIKQTANQLIKPKSYIVLSGDPDNIRSNYFVPDSAVIVKASIPAYNDDKGTPGIIYINNGIDVWLDSFYYDKKFHYPLLAAQDGVALERINFNTFESGPSNWHSAASTAGFGTPGYINSQYFEGNTVHGKGIFSLSSKRVSPDNDGYEDFLLVKGEFPQPGFSISAYVYDAQGRKIKELANNELAGKENTFEWNGLTDEQTLPPLGIYIVFVKYFDLEGNVFEEKLPVVVAGKL